MEEIETRKYYKRPESSQRPKSLELRSFKMRSPNRVGAFLNGNSDYGSAESRSRKPEENILTIQNVPIMGCRNSRI